MRDSTGYKRSEALTQTLLLRRVDVIPRRVERKSDGKRGDAIKACVPAQVIRFAVRLSRVNREQVSDCASCARLHPPRR